MATYLVDRNNVITMNRGDFFEFELKLNRGRFPKESIIELEDDDVIYFALMKPHQPFERSIFKKEFTKNDQLDNGNVIVKFLPEDTLFLDSGTYYYEVKMIYTSGDSDEPRVDTIVQKTKFIIVE